MTKATNMPSQYPWSSTMKTVAVELWKAKVPLKKIRAQLNMPERPMQKPILVNQLQKGKLFLGVAATAKSPHPC